MRQRKRPPEECMKKSIIALLVLVCVILSTALAGCSGGLDDAQVLSVRNRRNGKIVSIGETQAEAEKITGTNYSIVSEFDDGVVRYSYFNAEGLAVDILEDRVVALRLTQTDDWEIIGKVRVGMEKSQVDEVYAANTYKEIGMAGGLLLAYDANGTPIAYAEDAPYMVTISFEDDVVNYIGIQDNFESDYYK